jgi:alpha-tubulin suppressor-like RCC1 family protein
MRALHSIPLLCALAACADGAPLHTEAPGPLAPSLTRLECLADPRGGSLLCGDVAPHLGGASAAIFGGQHRLVRLASTNASTDGVTFSIDVSVQNLSLQPLGTMDGSSPHPHGIRVFFVSDPTNGVTVANPDGIAMFTGAAQPYHEYSASTGRIGAPGFLVVGESSVSFPKRWEFTLNDATSSFRFTVLVSAAVAEEAGMAVSLDTIVAGGQEACGLTSSGRAWCWGTYALRPVQQGALVFETIHGGGGRHFCGLVEGGQAYCWGANGFGQLGDSTTTDRTTPTPVKQQGVAYMKMALGSFHSCGLDAQGQAYCWGTGGGGRLGNGEFTGNQLTPQPVIQTGYGGLAFVSLAARVNTCALTAEGQAYCWGYNGSGQLGNGTSGPPNRATPRLVTQTANGGFAFAQIALGPSHVCGTTTEGKGYCWGENGRGRLGDGTTTNRSTPRGVTGGLTFRAVVPGRAHTCGVTPRGRAHCWGRGIDGQLGYGLFVDSIRPVAVSQDSPERMRFHQVVGGGEWDWSCGRTAAGRVYCWGSPALGTAGASASPTPYPVARLE